MLQLLLNVFTSSKLGLLFNQPLLFSLQCALTDSPKFTLTFSQPQTSNIYLGSR